MALGVMYVLVASLHLSILRISKFILLFKKFEIQDKHLPREWCDSEYKNYLNISYQQPNHQILFLPFISVVCILMTLLKMNNFTMIHAWQEEKFGLECKSNFDTTIIHMRNFENLVAIILYSTS